MKNFKPGMKVVFKRIGYVNPELNCPQENETVTIERKCIEYHGHWDILEYPKAKCGIPQSLPESCLFPLEERGISLTMHRAELSQLKPKEVLEETIKNNLMHLQ